MIRHAWVFSLLLVGSLGAATKNLSLPNWTDEDQKALKEGKWVPGRYLLSEEGPPDEPAFEKLKPLDAEGPTPEDLAGEQTPASEIPEKFLASYFNERPKTYLVDPQKLLAPKQYQDRLAFLDYHASETSVDLFIYVFERSQEIPGAARAEEVAERFFSTGRPAAIVYYFLGDPQRTVLYLSPSLTDRVSADDQRRTLQSSIEKSLEKQEAGDQLDAFSVQMSIRLYWMERVMSGATIPQSVSALGAVDGKAAFAHQQTSLLDRLPSRWWQPVVLLLGCAVGGLLVKGWVTYRARYRFPDFNAEPRLGGDHAAGIGAVISFSSAAQPPGGQREQVPEYLRRV